MRFTIGNGQSSTFNDIQLSAVASGSGSTNAFVCNIGYRASVDRISGLGSPVLTVVTGSLIWDGLNVMFPFTVNASLQPTGIVAASAVVNYCVGNWSDDVTVEVGPVSITINGYIPGVYNPDYGITTFDLSQTTIVSTKFNLDPPSNPFNLPAIIDEIAGSLNSLVRGLYYTAGDLAGNAITPIIQNLIRINVPIVTGITPTPQQLVAGTWLLTDGSKITIRSNQTGTTSSGQSFAWTFNGYYYAFFTSPQNFVGILGPDYNTLIFNCQGPNNCRIIGHVLDKRSILVYLCLYVHINNLKFLFYSL